MRARPLVDPRAHSAPRGRIPESGHSAIAQQDWSCKQNSLHPRRQCNLDPTRWTGVSKWRAWCWQETYIDDHVSGSRPTVLGPRTKSARRQSLMVRRRSTVKPRFDSRLHGVPTGHLPIFVSDARSLKLFEQTTSYLRLGSGWSRHGAVRPKGLEAEQVHFTGDTLDDLLHEVYPALLTNGREIVATRGSVKEILGVTIELKKPRARLSRSETRGKPFSCLGELLWYLSKSDKLEFIAHYVPKYEKESEDSETVHGAYGPRLFSQRGNDQVENVIALLKKKPTTRRAVVQIFDADDLARDYKEIPCTTTCQFFIREGRLDMVTTMRSNDAYFGLPHDIFCFTMVQELIACRLKVSLGTYYHFASNLHLYSSNFESVEAFLKEGVQSTWEMPAMPKADPRPGVVKLLQFERKLREQGEAEYAVLVDDPYWHDLGRLLHLHSLQGNRKELERVQAELEEPGYGMYAAQLFDQKIMKQRKPARQLSLPV
jgi:thymidylate synthase